MKVITSQKIPIKIWADVDKMESKAFDQMKNLANLPFAFKHIAIMPDVHPGYGMPIGGIMAAEKVVIPNAVGVDIGCGMCAVKTSLTEIDTETLKKIMGEIRKVIPVGFEHHREEQNIDLMPLCEEEKRGNKGDFTDLPIVEKEYESALKQIGTLGGGNHFIEIQKGDDGFIWIMIHSGSRNIGFKIANHYNKIAKQLNEKWYSSVPLSWELAYLPMDSEEGETYIREMKYAVEFALANRKLMMDRVINIFVNNTDRRHNDTFSDFDKMINIAHNYAAMENHFGQNVMVHRKGATQARKGQVGIIPGSQGTKSYIVEGLGNPESFESCSHGAGRTMGRNQARKNLSLKGEQEKLRGIIHNIRHEKDLDEAPSAYKDIEDVMKHQEDLIKIKVELTPLAVIKG